MKVPVEQMEPNEGQLLGAAVTAICPGLAWQNL